MPVERSGCSESGSRTNLGNKSWSQLQSFQCIVGCGEVYRTFLRFDRRRYSSKTVSAARTRDKRDGEGRGVLGAAGTEIFRCFSLADGTGVVGISGLGGGRFFGEGGGDSGDYNMRALSATSSGINI